MKKFLILLSVVLFMLLFFIYVGIPDKPVRSKVVIIKSTGNMTYTYLSDENKWNRWWPGSNAKSMHKSEEENDVFHFNENTFQLSQALSNAVEVVIGNKSSNIKTFITIVSMKTDSVKVEWQFSSVSSNNPVKRVRQYLNAKHINDNMGAILLSLQSFLEKKENIYGINIRTEKVRDTLLIAAKSLTMAYPTTPDIYNLIDQLRNYIHYHGAKESNYPMMHVTSSDSGRYEIMVAIPVNKALPDYRNFLYKRMVPGKILVTEVKGGPASVNLAFAQLENYINDYRLESPAIPFESLVTNRLRERDSARWITKIYYPVF